MPLRPLFAAHAIACLAGLSIAAGCSTGRTIDEDGATHDGALDLGNAEATGGNGVGGRSADAGGVGGGNGLGGAGAQMPGTGGTDAGLATDADRADADPAGSDGAGPDVGAGTDAGQYRVTVMVSGGGTVTSEPAGIDCGTTCSMLAGPGPVTLTAHTTTGSAIRFSNWSDAACPGPARVCTLNIAAPTTVTATFTPITANLIFMTAATFQANLGSATAYDAKCNQAATAAGLNNLAGTAYVAMISDSASLGKDRLGLAVGWIRMDGTPFANTQSSLFDAGQVFNSIRFDENGDRLSEKFALTGSNGDGTLSIFNCANWTTTTGVAAAGAAMWGSSAGGPGWLTGVSGTCQVDQSLICMGKTRTNAVTPIVQSGKKIWQSPAYAVGSVTPDAQCQLNRPAGVTAAAAFVSFTNRPAASVLSPTAIYVRPDGTQVGTGAQLAAGGDLDSGIWQLGTGEYSSAVIWTGSTMPTALGTAASTCANWTSPSSTTEGQLGWSPYDTNLKWWSGGVSACSSQYFLYCVEP